MDAKRDSEMTKLTNWLLFGLSSSDIHGSTPDFHFDDTILHLEKPKWHSASELIKEFSEHEKAASPLDVAAPASNSYYQLFLN